MFSGSQTGHLKVTGDLTDGTDALTMAELADLLMYGSANAAWVPCPFTIESVVGKVVGTWTQRNLDNTNVELAYTLPLPTVKGSLKLYVSGTKIELYDADATNFIDSIIVRGVTRGSGVALDTNAGNYDSPQTITDTWAAVDCSSYEAIKVQVAIDVDTASALDIGYVAVQCYYA